MTDFLFADHGSITLLIPLTPPAQDWVEEHLPEDRRTWGNGTVIEPRYVGPILEGIVADDLTVSS